jgi:hypothetical protein
MSKIGYTVIIERIARLYDCNKDVKECPIKMQKTFDTIDEANEFVSSFKHKIYDSAKPEFSLSEDINGYVNIIERSPDKNFEFETRFTFE